MNGQDGTCEPAAKTTESALPNGRAWNGHGCGLGGLDWDARECKNWDGCGIVFLFNTPDRSLTEASGLHVSQVPDSTCSRQ